MKMKSVYSFNFDIIEIDLLLTLYYDDRFLKLLMHVYFSEIYENEIYLVQIRKFASLLDFQKIDK